MDETMIYKCPNCGSVLAYDTEKDVMTCSQCSGTFSLAEAEAFNKQQEEQHFQNAQYTKDDSAFASAVKGFTCQNCGAQIMTDETTAATFCTFCGSPAILPSQLSGVYRPAQVIPFKISKEEAQESFRKWCHNGQFTPSDFASPQELEKITGIYVPFWLFDCAVDGMMTAQGTKVRRWNMGDYLYTNTKRYAIRRRAMMDFLKVPADGSKNLDDKMMDLLEPYDYSAMAKFEMPYLSGFQAEKYDETAQDVFHRVKDRVDQYTRSKVNETISGYSSVVSEQFRNFYRGTNAVYTLLPVWFHSYRYKGKTYQFMMNGQTGKVVGKPPLSAGKVALKGSLIALGIFALMFGGGLLL